MQIDKSSFRFIQDTGSEYKRIYSRVLWCKQVDLGYGVGYNKLHLNKYNAYFNDQDGIEFQVDSRIARSYAQHYAKILGRIPFIFRKCLKTFQIIKGLFCNFEAYPYFYSPTNLLFCPFNCIFRCLYFEVLIKFLTF